MDMSNIDFSRKLDFSKLEYDLDKNLVASTVNYLL